MVLSWYMDKLSHFMEELEPNAHLSLDLLYV